MKHKGSIPIRSCVGCGVKKPKDQLVRVVKDLNGCIIIDSDKRISGRGAYVCGEQCLELAKKRKGFERSFRSTVDTSKLGEAPCGK